MHRVFLTVVACGAFASIAVANIVKLSGTYTSDQIRVACSQAGGSFSIHEDGAGYGCEKTDCDGKGGNCVVACEIKTSTCQGSTPGRISPIAGLADVLSPLNEAVVDRDPNSRTVPIVIAVVVMALVAVAIAIYRRSVNQQRRPPATQ